MYIDYSKQMSDTGIIKIKGKTVVKQIICCSVYYTTMNKHTHTHTTHACLHAFAHTCMCTHTHTHTHDRIYKLDNILSLMLLLSLCTLFELSMIEPEIFVVDGN